MTTPLVQVTITGADDQVDPFALVALARDFPFVEWGVLFSEKRTGTPRYPSTTWVEGLVGLDLRLSAHLCGQMARDTAGGRLTTALGRTRFERLQINGYERTYLVGVSRLADCINHEIILQARGEEALQSVANDATLLPRASVLFDPSGGRGIESFSWPKAPLGIRMGYAGGIAPENVETVVSQILAANGHLLSRTIWLDMESGVRTSNDAFSLPRVREVLERVAKINARHGGFP
jgi:phosphoribosylanthranilate isomerase